MRPPPPLGRRTRGHPDPAVHPKPSSATLPASGPYWPGPDDFWSAVGTTLEAQLQRYDAVIHLRTPRQESGYNQSNPLRIESALDAAAIDEQILRSWERHPRRFIVDEAPDFLGKVARALDALKGRVTGLLPTARRAGLEPAHALRAQMIHVHSS